MINSCLFDGEHRDQTVDWWVADLLSSGEQRAIFVNLWLDIFKTWIMNHIYGQWWLFI